jgi:hypothetical protein
MLDTSNKILILALCSSLVGCFDSKEKSSASSEPSSESVPVVMGSVSSENPCNSGKQGSIIYDQSQSQFYFCDNSQWVAVDLRGPKGDKGDKGDTGVAGTNGTNGAVGATGPVGPMGLQGIQGPQGPQGIQGVAGAAGANGRDGLDGNGVRLAIKENGQVKGLFMQYTYDFESHTGALIMLPSGDTIGIDMATGEYIQHWFSILYSESGCTGTMYSTSSPGYGGEVIGRIYVLKPINSNTISFAKAVEHIPAIQAKSARLYSPFNSEDKCIESLVTSAFGVRLEPIAPVPSLSHLAPIRFTP